LDGHVVIERYQACGGGRPLILDLAGEVDLLSAGSDDGGQVLHVIEIVIEVPELADVDGQIEVSFCAVLRGIRTAGPYSPYT
jgi:hypothetical protein